MHNVTTKLGHLPTALCYAALGYRCLPVVPGTKRAAVPWKPYQTETPTPKAYERWFGVEKHDIALITGEIIVVDCDDPKFFNVVTERCGATPMMSQTPRYGRHFYYRPPPDVQLGNRVHIDGIPIDLRAAGGYVVVPWSANAEGIAYQWLAGPVPLTELPVIRDTWLRRQPSQPLAPLIITGPRMERARAYLAQIEGAVSGHAGHNRTMRVAGVLVQKFGLSIAEALPLFLEWNTRCDPPWSEKDLLHKLQDAYRLSHPKGGMAT